MVKSVIFAVKKPTRLVTSKKTWAHNIYDAYIMKEMNAVRLDTILLGY